MNLLKSILATFTFLCIFYIAHSQENEIWYNVVSIPPSPNAAALGKYGEYSVDKSTGVPGISIPLLDIEDGGIKVPISLSYHASGIRVQEDPSWVGLGWVLNAGGVITRTVMGLPDEDNEGFLTNSEKVPLERFVGEEIQTPGIYLEIYNILKQTSEGYYDYEPDKFFFNIGGYSGTFMFGNHKKILVVPYQDLVIEPRYSTEGIIGFQIVDPNGIIYVFGDIEKTGYTEYTTPQLKGARVSFISSWHLQKIINPFTASEVNFYYTSYNKTSEVNYSQTQAFEYVLSGWVSKGGLVTNNSRTVIQNVRLLSKVALSDGSEVNFYTSSSLDGGMKLDYFTYGNTQSFKNYSFSYGYFMAGVPEVATRLKLTSVAEKSSDNKESKVHSFEYNPLKLPLKNSTSVDHWGFFNGKNNGNSLIPTVNISGLNYSGANREPDPIKAQACMLTKINYPTGGYTQFEFEGNSYPESSTTTGTNCNNYLTNDVIVTGSGFKTPETNQMTLSMFNPEVNYTEFRIFGNVTISNMDNYNRTNHFGRVNIVDGQGVIRFSKNIYLDQPLNEVLPNSIGLTTNQCTVHVFANGEITTAKVWLSYNVCSSSQTTSTQLVYGGGLRIKQINTYDPVSGSTISKTYDYNNSGYINGGLPRYYTNTIYVSAPENRNCHENDGILLHSSPIGLGSSSNSVSYSSVTEYFGTPSVNSGRVVTNYLSYMDIAVGNAMYVSPLSQQWLRSKVSKDSTFSDQNVLLKTTSYEYEFDLSHKWSIRGFKASRVLINSCMDFVENDRVFHYGNFEHFIYNHRVKSIVSKDYPKTGTPIATTQTYFYENNNHLNPTRIETNTSNGKSLKTTFKYPLDYSSCNNNSESIYINTLNSCQDLITEYRNELANCRSIYGACNDIFMACIKDAPNCFKVRNFFNSYCHDDSRNCQVAFSNCLTTNNFFTCLESANNYYTPCVINAGISYQNNQNAYQQCLFDDYSNATNPEDKALKMLPIIHNNNQLIEKIVQLDDKIVERYKFSFQKIDSPYTIPMMLRAEKELDSQGYNTAITYDKYDQNLNLVQVTPKGSDAVNSYYWGYNGKFPVAKFDNMAYSFIESNTNGLRDALDQLDDFKVISNSTIQTQLKTLNDQIRTKIPSGCMVTTYTYDPLVGMTSQTDPNGITTYYEYDGLGRLHLVKDHEGNILKRYDYQYAK